MNKEPTTLNEIPLTKGHPLDSKAKIERSAEEYKQDVQALVMRDIIHYEEMMKKYPTDISWKYAKRRDMIRFDITDTMLEEFKKKEMRR